MASADQQSQEQWLAAGNFHDDGGADIDCLLNSISHPTNNLLSQVDALNEDSRYNYRSMYQDDNTEDDRVWMRLNFNTAPPFRNPPSQVEALRGYYTDPQSRHGQCRVSPTSNGTGFTRDEDVDFGCFFDFDTNGNDQISVDATNIAQSHLSDEIVQGSTACSPDNTAMSLIENYIKLYPTTFFYKEKIAALATLTNIPSQSVEKAITRVLTCGLSVSSDKMGSSTSSENSKLTNQPLQDKCILKPPDATKCSMGMTTLEGQSHQTKEVQLKQPISLQVQCDQTLSKRRPKQTCTQKVSRLIFERPILAQAAKSLLGGKAEKCQSTSNTARLSRDESRIYQCTFKCGARFRRKADLRRHEEEKNYPQEGWICDVDAAVFVEGVHTCAYCTLQNPPMDHATIKHTNRKPFCHEKEIDARGKIFTRKKRFVEHFKAFHPALQVTYYLKICQFVVKSKFPRWCGFCEQFRDFDGSKTRNDHMASHFEDGLDMTKWKDAISSGDIEDEDGDTDWEKDSATDEDTNEDKEGDNKGEYGGANGKMDRDKTDGNPSLKRRREDGPSGRFESRCDSTAFNNTFSALRLHISIRQTLNCDGSSLQRCSRLNSILFSPEPQKSTLHDNPYSAALVESLSPSRVASREDEKFQKSPARQPKAEKPNLGIALREARVRSESNQFFLPVTEIQRLITFGNVLQELNFYYGETGMTEALASLVIRNAQKLFAILVFLGDGSAIANLILEDAISDLDLPISWNKIGRLSAFSKWSNQTIEEFGRNQWSFIPPILGPTGLHHEFDDHVVLPFIEGHHSLVVGGNSEVRSAKVHFAHQKLFPLSLGSPLLVAVKQLRSIDPKDFEAETMMLRQLAKKDHSHVVKLLATYRLKERYHLVFPWASKNLRTYWQDNSNPQWSSDEILWILRQMVGITSAIHTIHNFEDTATTLYGYHGDIKPENILYFNKIEGRERVLQITDFGSGRFHNRDSRSNIDPRTVRSTRTYEPPEVALLKPVSRACDVWGLGCVFLEFITWGLGGQNLLDEFRSRGFGVGEDSVSVVDEFYSVVQFPSGKSRAHLRTRVRYWMQILIGNGKCSEVVYDLICLIRDDLLVIDAENRKSSASLLDDLRKLLERAENDGTYLLNPYAHKTVTEHLQDIGLLGNPRHNEGKHNLEDVRDRYKHLTDYYSSFRRTRVECSRMKGWLQDDVSESSLHATSTRKPKSLLRLKNPTKDYESVRDSEYYGRMFLHS